MRYEDDEYDSTSSGGYLLRSLGLMCMGGLIAAGLLVSLGIWRTSDRLFSTFNRVLNAPPPTPKVDVQSIVIQQIRDASELTTAAFTMQAVVPTSQDNSIGGFVIGTTKLLYIAHGEVKAGVDLSQLTTNNVQVAGETVQIQLPPPRILDSKIDVSRSKVYDYNRGMLGLGPDVAPELQTLAQQEALEKVTEAACQDGLLTKASDRAKLVVSQLLNTAGYRSVSVGIQSPPENACVVFGNSGNQGNQGSQGNQGNQDSQGNQGRQGNQGLRDSEPRLIEEGRRPQAEGYGRVGDEGNGEWGNREMGRQGGERR